MTDLLCRPCPVCRGAGSTLLYHQSFEQLSSARLLDGYDVVVCQHCGAGFADGIPPQAAFDRYYRDLSKYDDRDSRPAAPALVEPRFHDMADILARFIVSPDSRVFEIGCASGGLLRALQERGFRNLIGSDPSPACVTAARQLHGIESVAGTVFSVPKPAVPYDFLVLTGVMEHIRDLERTVERFHELLAGHGRVYLEVPDASRYTPRQDAPFQEFSLEHINYFSPCSLTNLLRTRGFRVLEAARVVRPQHEIACPCTYAVFERSPHSAAIERDTETEPGLRAYIEGCRAEDARIRAVIRQAVAPGERMIVWGVGAHTLRLLATGGLDPAQISLFVDSNPNYQQQELCGIPVASPRELDRRREPILISSCSSQNAIHNQIRGAMGLPNQVILLYAE